MTAAIDMSHNKKMPEQKHILMCTTEKLPGPEGDREVKRMTVTWSTDHVNIRVARDALADWAMKNNFDAVIGIRIEPHPHASYNSVGSGLRWTIYGTAIGW